MTAFSYIADSDIDTDEYPNLGFNPAPGSPASVSALTDTVQVAANGLSEADRLLSQLRSSSSSAWQGDAADAFRSHVNTNLAPDLEHAQESLSKAVGVLQSWLPDLVSDKQQAQELEQQAAQARQAKAQADQVLQSAQSNPDLGLAGRVFTNANDLAAATARYNNAVSILNNAQTNSDNAAADLGAILQKAQALKWQHTEDADRHASDLAACTNDLAPHKPGLLHRIGSAIGGAVSSAFHAVAGFVKAHLKQIHEVLSDISAACGLLALITPPPADAIFGGVALIAGAGALGCDLADPNFRHNIGQLLSGHVNKQTLGALATGVGDVASVIPGGGALAKVATKAEDARDVVKLGEHAGTTLYGTTRSVSKAFSTTAHDAGIVNRGIAKTVERVPGLTRLDGALAPGLNKVLDLGSKAEHGLADHINLIKKVHSVESKLQSTFGGNN